MAGANAVQISGVTLLEKMIHAYVKMELFMTLI